jgi:hypothetical protein
MVRASLLGRTVFWLCRLLVWCADDGRGIGGVGVTAGSAGIGYALRYGFIEPVALGTACETGGTWWCALRGALIRGAHWGVPGWTTLALCALAFWRARSPGGHRGFAWATLAMGGAGLPLYNATLSSIGVLLAGLLLVRPQTTEQPPAFVPSVMEPGSSEHRTT